MVDFVTWREAKELVRREPVLFAEIMTQTPETQSLEIHVMTPTGAGLHELERDDTGAMPGERCTTCWPGSPRHATCATPPSAAPRTSGRRAGPEQGALPA